MSEDQIKRIEFVINEKHRENREDHNRIFAKLEVLSHSLIEIEAKYNGLEKDFLECRDDCTEKIRQVKEDFHASDANLKDKLVGYFFRLLSQGSFAALGYLIARYVIK